MSSTIPSTLAAAKAALDALTRLGAGAPPAGAGAGAGAAAAPPGACARCGGAAGAGAPAGGGGESGGFADSGGGGGGGGAGGGAPAGAPARDARWLELSVRDVAELNERVMAQNIALMADLEAAQRAARELRAGKDALAQQLRRALLAAPTA